ncbi:brain acid soluble protein 1-like isoform X1 [Periplaneta americana]|uniref:brain acid soluble protein 1-like isoform X1 n=1 Tax=Periplaneta americana TaxID=6978 RepID=UPI0037E8146D
MLVHRTYFCVKIVETTTVGTPEKKEVDKKVEVVDEDSKASENGDAEKPKENGNDNSYSAEDSKDKEVESAENGDSTDSVEVSATKRKSEGGDAPEGTPAEGASPEKKAKLEEKPADAEAKAANGEAEAVA